MFSQIRRWVSERWPLEALIRLSLEEEMPGGASFAYIFGSSLVLIFFIQAITGVCQLFYYVPATRQGLAAIQQLTLEGINLNVTLLFGLPRYREVGEAYITGLEEEGVHKFSVPFDSMMTSLQAKQATALERNAR